MNRFDELAKALAGGVTRRRALRALGGGLAGGLLAALGLGKARADNAWGQQCEEYCKSLGAHPLGQCVSSCVSCVKLGGTACGVDECCFGAEVCCGGNCGSCPEGQFLDPDTCECVECLEDTDCPGPGQCHLGGECVRGQCIFPTLANGTPCDDGNACTQHDTCQSGVCVGGNPVVCAGGRPCDPAVGCVSVVG
jgi:hypothetical protein